MSGILLALALDLTLLQEAVEVFTPALEVFIAAGERSRAYDEFQREMGRQDSQMSLSDSIAVLEVMGNRFYFDEDGYLWFDDRFVRPDERAAIEAVNRFYRKHLAADAEREREEERKKAGVVKKKPVLPVFRGYEAARYQQYDALIARMVADFNAHKARWCGAGTSLSAPVAAWSVRMRIRLSPVTFPTPLSWTGLPRRSSLADGSTASCTRLAHAPWCRSAWRAQPCLPIRLRSDMARSCS